VLYRGFFFFWFIFAQLTNVSGNSRHQRT
jgi:hypothetical protein